MAGVYTVSQINAYIKNLFVRDYALSNICVKGEVSNCKYHTSGHIYFTLKDEGGAIACVMFARDRQGLGFRLSDGQQVEVRGQISVYEKTGSYQLYARSAALSGRGELYERFEKLKQELQEMGMFDPCYKKPIPAYAMRVGIVTAPTGAAIQDICNISRRRNPYVELILYPALVQGRDAADSIVRGIRTLDRMGLDVLIVGRGGGSIEDLWAFNEEKVARAIFDAETPIISAVGHETDFTIADFAADLRAPTPSAAAELANFEYNAFLEEVESFRSAFERGILGKLDSVRNGLMQRRLSLQIHSPGAVLKERKSLLSEYRLRMLQTLNDRTGAARLRLENGRQQAEGLMQARLSESRHRLELTAGRLHGLSPLRRISGGFGYLMDDRGQGIRSVRELSVQDRFTACLSDGRIRAEVLALEPEETVSRKKEQNHG